MTNQELLNGPRKWVPTKPELDAISQKLLLRLSSEGDRVAQGLKAESQRVIAEYQELRVENYQLAERCEKLEVGQKELFTRVSGCEDDIYTLEQLEQNQPW